MCVKNRLKFPTVWGKMLQNRRGRFFSLILYGATFAIER